VIASRVAAVRERIARAAARAGRSPEDVTLSAVSKTQPPEAVREGFAAGLRHFGENKVQEAEDKIAALSDLRAEGLRWHMIGHVQSNKGRRVAELFDAVDSVDDATLALARFQNGAVGYFEATRFAPGRKNYNRFEINGSKGSLVFNMERPNELEVYTEDTRVGTFGFRTVSVTGGQDPYSGHYWPTAHNIGYEHTFINLLFDAFTAIGKGECPDPNFHDGYINNVVLDAIEKSSQTRQWESITP